MPTAIQILFVSRRGHLRAQLAAGCLAHLAKGRFRAHACGQPGELAKEVHPAAADTLRRALMGVPGEAPRSWDEFRRMGAPRMDFVITLDADVASHQPPWPSQPGVALWNYPDLLDGELPASDLAHRSTLTLHSLRRRLELLTSLPMHGASALDLRSDIRDMAFLA